MAPHLLENTRNRVANGRPDELDPGIAMRVLSWPPGLAVTSARKTGRIRAGDCRSHRPRRPLPPGSRRDALRRSGGVGRVDGDSQMAPHLLENTRNRLENGRPRELDPGITMRLLSWRPGLAAAPASKASCKRLKTFKSRAVERSAAGNARTAAVRRRAMTDGPTPASGPTLPLSKSKARAGYSERLALPEIDC